MTTRPRLSVAIITRDEAHRIARCLQAVDFADEIVVLDSGSTDGTAELARTLGAQVVVDPHFPGFGAQKNRALAMASGDWVLSIDADEVVTAALRDAIVAAIAQPRGCCGFWIRRRSTWCGRPIYHGDWRDDRVLRLFARGAARFSDDLVHERVLCPTPHGELAGWLLHDSVDSPADAQAKMLRYARLGAEKLRAKGKGGLVAACTHAFWTFMRGYLMRGGLLDGRAGLAIAATNARGTYLRYRWAALPPAQLPPLDAQLPQPNALSSQPSARSSSPNAQPLPPSAQLSPDTRPLQAQALRTHSMSDRSCSP